MSIVCNLGSLVLGLAAWGIPLCAIGRKYRFGICCIGSLSCCVLSFLLQLLEVRNRVRLNDWSALMDTIERCGGGGRGYDCGDADFQCICAVAH